MVRRLEPTVRLQNDADHVAWLCLETLVGGHSAVVFCPTKNWCEKMATSLSAEFFQLGAKADATPLGLQVRRPISFHQFPFGVASKYLLYVQYLLYLQYLLYVQ